MENTIVAEIQKRPGGYEIKLDNGKPHFTRATPRAPYKGIIQLANRCLPGFDKIRLTLKFEDLSQ